MKQILSDMSFPWSITRISDLVLESSRAANKPAGPAPTMITSIIQSNIYLNAIYIKRVKARVYLFFLESSRDIRQAKASLKI
jgi:hypothetical protein